MWLSGFRAQPGLLRVGRCTNIWRRMTALQLSNIVKSSSFCRDCIIWAEERASCQAVQGPGTRQRVSRLAIHPVAADDLKCRDTDAQRGAKHEPAKSRSNQLLGQRTHLGGDGEVHGPFGDCCGSSAGDWRVGPKPWAKTEGDSVTIPVAHDSAPVRLIPGSFGLLIRTIVLDALPSDSATLDTEPVDDGATCTKDTVRLVHARNTKSKFASVALYLACGRGRSALCSGGSAWGLGRGGVHKSQPRRSVAMHIGPSTMRVQNSARDGWLLLGTMQAGMQIEPTSPSFHGPLSKRLESMACHGFPCCRAEASALC